jgi:hypothetical protein
MTDSAPALDGSASDVTIAPTATETSASSHEPVGDVSERDAASYDAEVKSLRAEAKRHRLAQRAAESERDTLRTRVDAQDRREVERIAGDHMQNAADIWLTTQIGDLRDEEGEIDREKINERVEQLLSDRPHWRKPNGPAPGFSSGVRQPLKPARTIGQAFKNSLGGR